MIKAALVAELEAERAVRAAILDRHRLIPLPDEPAAVETGDEDVDGQCLRIASAAVLRVSPRSLPVVPEGPDRFDVWAGKMMTELGWRIENLSLDEIPPVDGQPWVAIIDSGDETHAVGCVGLTALNYGSERQRTIRPAHVLSAFRFTAAK